MAAPPEDSLANASALVGPAEALRAAADKLVRIAAALERAEEDRALTLAGIAHDLRLPLSRLRLEAEMAVGDPQALSLMAADIEEIDTLVGLLVALGRATAKPVRVDAVQVHDAFEQAAAGFQQRGLLQLDNRIDPAWRVRADPAALQRVLRNLLDNAVRHGQAQATGAARVLAQAQRAGHELAITVCDEGPGVGVDEWAALARPFFRGRRQRDSSGTGLGLWIVRQTLQSMGGSLQLAPAPDGGLLATLHLPIADEPLPEDTVAEGSDALEPGVQTLKPG